MSPAKTAANRANAQRSTGPRTAQGKKASALNARRHGLSRPTTLVGEAADQSAAFAAALCQGNKDRFLVALAAAEILHRREEIAAVRRRAICLALERIDLGEQGTLAIELREDLALLAALPELLKFEDYDRRAASQLRKLLKQL